MIPKPYEDYDHLIYAEFSIPVDVTVLNMFSPNFEDSLDDEIVS